MRKAKHEYVLFCDGDIIVENKFVELAKNKFKEDEYLGIVGGLITNPMDTPAQELMAVLRFRAFFKGNNPNGCFMVKRELFNNGFNRGFGEAPNEDISFYKSVQDAGFTFKKVLSELCHIGEPKTMTELLQRQCKYGEAQTFDFLRFFIFCWSPLGKLLFLIYYKYYKNMNISKYKFNTSFNDLSNLYASFMAVYYWGAYSKFVMKNGNK